MATFVKKVARVQGAVSQEFKERPMKLIGSGFGDRMNDSPARLTVFGAKVVAEDLEFANCFNPETPPADPAGCSSEKVVGGRSILKEKVLIYPGSIDRDRCSRPALRIVCRGKPGPEHPGLQQGQLHEISPIKWQIPDLLVIDQFSDGRGSRLYQRGLGGDGDLFT